MANLPTHSVVLSGANNLPLTLSRMNLLLSLRTAERPLGDASLSSLEDARQCIYADRKSVDGCLSTLRILLLPRFIRASVLCANNTRFPRRFYALTERRMRLRRHLPLELSASLLARGLTARFGSRLSLFWALVCFRVPTSLLFTKKT